MGESVLTDVVADIHLQPPRAPDKEHHADALGHHRKNVQSAKQWQSLGGFPYDKVVDSVTGEQRIRQVRAGDHQQYQNGADDPGLILQAVVHKAFPDL